MGRKIPPQDPDSWQDFSKFLFSFGEADPGYYVVRGLIDAGVPMDQIERFVIGWTTFYNLGIAAKVSELKGAKFYAYLNDIYPTAKRASERRHFRGAAGLGALAQWQRQWPNPEDLADHMLKPNGTLDDVRIAATTVSHMGPYMTWKYGDLTEIVTGEPLQFRGFEKLSPKVPTEGAALIADEAGVPVDTARIYRSIAKYMNTHGVRSFATPWRDMDVQDGETVCCVYKQYRSGSYWPGVRTAKALARLIADGEGCDTAKLGVTVLEKLAAKTGLYRQFNDTQHAVDTMLLGEYRVAPTTYLKARK